jgi:streptogramin lyase
LLASALAMLACWPGSALATPKITEFPLPFPYRGPAGIAAGPGGDLWFTQSATNDLGISTVAGSISQYPGLSGPARGITAAGDELWVTEPGANRIALATSATRAPTEFRAYNGSTPTTITVGPDGNVWFTEPGAIGRLDPSNETIDQFTYDSGSLSAASPAITAGPDGNLWFTESSDPGRIGQITTAGTIAEFSTPTANSQPDEISVGPDGNLWFTEAGNHGKLGMIAISTSSATTIAPTAVTSGATGVQQTVATIHGQANPDSTATTYHFDWGQTIAYGQQAPADDASVGSDDTLHQLSQQLTGLVPDTMYHYRLVASNCGGCQSGTSYGADATLVTAASAPLQVDPGDPLTSPGTAAPTALGRTAVAGTTSGIVLVRVPGSSALRSLAANEDIPIGSLIDATDGVVKLTTAVNKQGHTQSATVWAGAFVVTQSPSRRGMTTFRLAATPRCPARAHAAALMAETARVAAKKPTTSLWPKDNHGQYSTRGQNSVATVRGTAEKPTYAVPARSPPPPTCPPMPVGCCDVTPTRSWD